MASSRPIFADDTAADEAADAEALASLKAGRTLSHEAVMAWLRSWGTADELPPPKLPSKDD